MKNLRRDQRGSSLVEFALILPLFLFVVGTMLSLLWLVSARSAITGAARDAVRYASIRHDPLTCPPEPAQCDRDWPDSDEVRAYAEQRAGRFGNDMRVSVVRPTQPNDEVSVTIQRDLPVILRTLGSIFHADELTYTSTGLARAE
jgi:hypothetical protein